MKTPPHQTLWAGLFPMAAAIPITCIHHGIECQEEVVRAGRLSSELCQGPGKGSHFKIVLVHERTRNGLSEQIDAKTDVCLPASSSGQQVPRIIDEVSAAEQAECLTMWDGGDTGINIALRERRNDLEGSLAAEESKLFSNGLIRVHKVHR